MKKENARSKSCPGIKGLTPGALDRPAFIATCLVRPHEALQKWVSENFPAEVVWILSSISSPYHVLQNAWLYNKRIFNAKVRSVDKSILPTY